MAGESSRPIDFSRRRMLLALGLAAAGGGLLLLTSGFPLGSKSTLGTVSQTRSSSSTASSSAGPAVASGGPFVRIKVKYFQMSSALPGVNQEYYILPSPAHYPDLLNAVTSSHPALSGMMSSMLVLAEGMVARSDTLLRSGDEVDFIPTVSGG